MNLKDLHILVGVPVLDVVGWEFFLHTITLVSRMGKSCRRVDLCAPNRCSIDRARQICVDTARRNGADRILFIDDDTILPLDTPEFLESVMSTRPDCVAVSGVCYQRGYPYNPMIYKYEGFDWKKGTLSNQLLPPLPCDPFRISASGMGVCLLNVPLLSKIPDDCFGRRENGTEDFFFYEKAAKVGLEAWCNPIVEATHLGERDHVTPETARVRRKAIDLQRIEGMDEILANTPTKPGQLIQYLPQEDCGRGKVIVVEEVNA